MFVLSNNTVIKVNVKIWPIPRLCMSKWSECGTTTYKCKNINSHIPEHFELRMIPSRSTIYSDLVIAHLTALPIGMI